MEEQAAQFKEAARRAARMANGGESWSADGDGSSSGWASEDGFGSKAAGGGSDQPPSASESGSGDPFAANKGFGFDHPTPAGSDSEDSAHTPGAQSDGSGGSEATGARPEAVTYKTRKTVTLVSIAFVALLGGDWRSGICALVVVVVFCLDEQAGRHQHPT